LTSDGTANGAIAQSGLTYNNETQTFTVTGRTYTTTGTLVGLSSTEGAILFSIPVEPTDRTIYIDYYAHETTDYSPRGGTLIVTTALDGSSIASNDLASGSNEFGVYLSFGGSVLDLWYGVTYGSWNFDYSIRILKAQPAPITYYALSPYGGSPLITAYTTVEVPYGSCFCSSSNVKYDSFGPTISIDGLTFVTGTLLPSCLSPC
jgi:hypothetical protein